MSYPIRIWSSAYSPSNDDEPFSIQVEKSLWERVMRQEGSRRKFLRVSHPEGLDDWFAPLGHPVDDVRNEEESKEEHKYNIYMPLWMMDAGHIPGSGEESTLDVVDDEYFPQATRIVFRVIDSAIYNADIKEELERALSSLGVIREHTTLRIPVAALGGYPVEVFLSKTEPANVVLCDGEEVAVEFEEPVDQIAPPRPPTPVPEPPPLLQTETLVPEAFARPSDSHEFQAFSGQGHLVGSSNANIPEWRRGLPPPKRR